MVETSLFKRILLRATLREVSPMVIRLISVSDQLALPEFHQIFCSLLGWSGNLDYIFRIHGQELNSFRRNTRAKTLHEFRLHRQEKFLYLCNTLDLWEWDIRVLDIQDGVEDDHVPVCVGGRGATPPEFCGGPTGYRLMLKRQREGAAMSDPVLVEAGLQMLVEACPEQPAQIWELLRTTLEEGFQSIDRRLQKFGPLEPNRFSVAEANQRLTRGTESRRIRA
jgi:Plasmid pRiA4b ORF-3-like protein